jgi:hypothetical protein
VELACVLELEATRAKFLRSLRFHRLAENRKIKSKGGIFLQLHRLISPRRKSPGASNDREFCKRCRGSDRPPVVCEPPPSGDAFGKARKQRRNSAGARASSPRFCRFASRFGECRKCPMGAIECAPLDMDRGCRRSAAVTLDRETASLLECACELQDAAFAEVRTKNLHPDG